MSRPVPQYVEQYARLSLAVDALVSQGKPIPPQISQSMARIEQQVGQRLSRQQQNQAMQYVERAKQEIYESSLKNLIVQQQHHADAGMRALAGHDLAQHERNLQGKKTVIEHGPRRPSNQSMKSWTTAIKEGGMNRDEVKEMLNDLSESKDIEKDLMQYPEASRASLRQMAKEWDDGGWLKYGLEERTIESRGSEAPIKEVIDPDESDVRRAQIIENMRDDPDPSALEAAVNATGIRQEYLEDEGMRGDIARSMAAFNDEFDEPDELDDDNDYWR